MGRRWREAPDEGLRRSRRRLSARAVGGRFSGQTLLSSLDDGPKQLFNAIGRTAESWNWVVYKHMEYL